MTTDDRGGWFPFSSPAGGGRTLLCVPCAGQGASAYRDWQRRLGPEIDVVPLQLPGREQRAREAPHTTMDGLVESLLPAALDRLGESCLLYGHSMGASVAFQLGWRMHQQGRPPAHLFVAAQRPPGEAVTEGESDLTNGSLHDLPEATFMSVLGLYGQVPKELFDDPAEVQRAATTLRADFGLAETYRPEPGARLGCPITALAGLADEQPRPAAMRGWAERTEAAFTLRPIPGDHFFPQQRAAEITALIRAAAGGDAAAG